MKTFTEAYVEIPVQTFLENSLSLEEISVEVFVLIVDTFVETYRGAPAETIMETSLEIISMQVPVETHVEIRLEILELCGNLCRNFCFCEDHFGDACKEPCKYFFSVTQNSLRIPNFIHF